MNRSNADQSYSSERVYAFANTEEAEEWQRLTAIEREFDPQTHRTLEALGIRPGCSCLEVGPGAGSIMRWMCDRVGEQGRVVAVDINPRFVEQGNAPNLEIVRADITTAELQSSFFDLIHARHVILHIKEYRKAIANLIRMLKPGGWLFLEEPDFTLSVPANNDTPAEQAAARTFDSVVALYHSMGIEPAIGRKLPVIFQQMNLQQIKVESALHLAAGGSNLATMMQRSLSHLKDSLVDMGVASSEDVDRFLQLTEDPNFWAIYYGTFGVCGQKLSSL